MCNLKKLKIIGLFIFLIGICLSTYPFLNMAMDDYMQYSRNAEFDNSIKKDALIEKKINKAKENANRQKKENDVIGDVFSDRNVDTVNSSFLDLSKKQGYLSIPKLGQSFDLYLDADYYKIAKGVAVLKGSDPPIGGLGKRCVIAGHSGYYNKVMFLNIHKLENGDKIIVNFLGKILEYKVYNKEKIMPTDVHKLEPIESEDMLTLLTCTQAPRYNMRLLVNARRNKVLDDKNSNNKETIKNTNIQEYLLNKDISSGIKIRKMFPYVVSFLGIVIIISILRKMTIILKS